jgi:DNA-binding winged helix-turn-helix (wHTH) protein
LTLLVARPGQLVTREELQRCLWPGNSFGDFETGLNAAVNRLRDYLSDSATEPNYLETVQGRGYRFIGKLERSNGEVGPGKTVSHLGDAELRISIARLTASRS